MDGELVLRGTAAVVAALLLGLVAANRWRCRRRRRRFRERFGSFEGFAREVDLDRVRCTRASVGDVEAIHELRAACPELSSVDATLVVRAL